ncbi:alpha/beta hydrolase [Cytobacillus sp. Hz8]|uniref:alpha/beta hydrolase n=1 Tax=Cytobacillus sp. Hz8 TaxID=3347168 RepID=UPI0035DB8200
MVTSSSFYFNGKDGQSLYARKWTSTSKPKAIVQITHGMAEHIGRYEDFASFLVSHELFVYGNDHRGHGHTATREEDIGYFTDNNGYETIVEDMERLTEVIQKEFPNTPIFLFGHSMGSFLSRRYIQLFGDCLQGVILSGTGGHPGFIGKVGYIIASREAKKHGRRKSSTRMNDLTFGSYNKSFMPVRSSFDWLSRNEKEVNKYIQDPLCGAVFTAGFFADFLKGLLSIYNDDDKIPKDLPIYFFSGTEDPVGKQTKGVLQNIHHLQAMNLEDISYKFYPEGRHEMLNEINKEEVYSDILEWILTHI